MIPTSNYTLEATDEKGVYQLMLNGVPVLCPYRQPLIVQTKMGQPKLVNIPCTNQCALFEYIIGDFRYKIKNKIKLHCSDRVFRTEIREDGNPRK